TSQRSYQIFRWGNSKTCPPGFPAPPAEVAHERPVVVAPPTLYQHGSKSDITLVSSTKEPPIFEQRPATQNAPSKKTTTATGSPYSPQSPYASGSTFGSKSPYAPSGSVVAKNPQPSVSP